MQSSDIWRPLALATLSGLSTTLGGILAVIHKPEQGLMAGLLGSAIGVMATVSLVELVFKNALENNAFLVMASTVAGAMGYYLLEPLIPKADLQHESKADLENEETVDGAGCQKAPQFHAQKSSSNLLRLGLLMAVTMTLHNLPEGFAVAFSAFTPLGPVMALAIAMHNIPEGVIIAAPIYAATGSRWKALALATASGLSEPLGALVALLLLRPFLNEARLQYLLAATGGLMLAVCVIELWPEARNCKNDRGLAIGIIIGTLVMGWTLHAEEGNLSTIQEQATALP